MDQYFELKQASLENAWVTIGSFDGVHVGHQAIISAMVAQAHAVSSPAAVITFHPHPAVVLRGRKGDFYLTLPGERAGLLSELGVDTLITIQFNAQTAATSARDFVDLLVRHLGMRQLWVGHDFALGHGREGNVDFLRQRGQEAGFTLNVIEPKMVDGEVISSSRIRALLEAGDVKKAAACLGRLYSLTGNVVPGDQRGRTIGIPTANLEIMGSKLKPATGVYACRAGVGEETWAAAVNIGVRPTFDGQSTTVKVEAHLLDFDGDLYGQSVTVEFLDYLRGEQRFPSIQALVEQIRIDIDKTRKIVDL